MQTNLEEKRQYQGLLIEIASFDIDVLTASSDDPYRDDGYGDLIWG